MINVCDLKARTDSNFSHSMQDMALQRYRIIGIDSKHKTRRKKSLAVGMSVVFSIVLISIISIAQPALSRPAAAPQATAQQSNMQLGSGLNEHADLLFLFAVPFGIAALISQCATLKQISYKIRK